MENLKVFQYNGNTIHFEEVDGKIMANATLMCEAFGKRANDWLALKSTQIYVEAITRKNGSVDNQLVTTRMGGVPGQSLKGTWINEKLILSLARWLDVNFEVWCDEKIAELLRTGKVELKTLTPAELILQQAQQLVNHERRLDDIDTRVKKIEANQPENINNHTIMGYAILKKAKIDYEAAKILGKKATKICIDRGLKTSYVPDPRYTQVRAYPKEVLEEVFNEFLHIDKN